MQKSTLIICANNLDKDSVLHTSGLPKEIAFHIAGNLHSVINKNCFFTLENLNCDVPGETKEEENQFGL